MQTKLHVVGLLYEVRPISYDQKNKTTGEVTKRTFLELTIEQNQKDDQGYRFKAVEKINLNTDLLSPEQKSELQNSVDRYIALEYEAKQFPSGLSIQPTYSFAIYDKNPLQSAESKSAAKKS
jgi:hypothetical protein